MLGLEAVHGRPSQEQKTHGASSTGTSSSQTATRHLAARSLAVGKAIALREELRSLVSDIGHRDMYASLRVCAEDYLKGLEAHTTPEV